MESRGPFLRIRTLLSLLLVISFIVSFMPTAVYAQTATPTITSDQADYPSGATVILTGTGWQPGESVHIIVNDTIGQTWTHDTIVTADSDGNFIDSFVLPTTFISDYGVTATGQISGTATTTFTSSSSESDTATSNEDFSILSLPTDCHIDSDGANDEPGQKDLTMACDTPTSTNPLDISWNWDVISMSGANTADGCALFDTDNDGLANYAVCVSWKDGRVIQTGYPQLYGCGDTRSDRCTNSTPLSISNGSTCSLELASDDPFAADDSYPQDAKTICSINLADVGGVSKSTLIDVCSYPSEQPNSDPSDCVNISAEKGNLEVVKNVDPDAPTTNWNMSWTGPTPYNGTITGDNATGIQAVNIGTYNITEAAGTGTDMSLYDTTWACTTDGSPTSSGSGTSISGVSVAKGSVVICTFTNTRKTGSLEIKKVVGFTSSPTNWNFDATGPTTYDCSISGSGTCNAKSVSTGSYSITETAGSDTSLSDYDTTWACTVNGSAGPSGSGATISGLTINKNDTVVCTFYNDNKVGSQTELTVNKVLVPSDDSGLFNLQIDGTTAGTGTNAGNGGTTGAVKVSAGKHTVGETAGTDTDLDDYTTVIGGDCAPDGNITLSTGDKKTCTITNTLKSGSLKIVKDVSPDNSSTNWNFAITGPSTPSCSIAGDGSCGPATVYIGSYSITETAGANTNLSDYGTTWACTVNDIAGPSGTGTSITGLTIAPDDAVVCTFTNSQSPGTLTVNKVVVPSSDTGLFNLLIDGTAKATGVGNGGTTGAVSLSAGSHTVNESAGTGTDSNNYVTTFSGDCDSSGKVSVQPNQNKTCTITNTRKGTIIVEKQTDPDGATGSFTFTGVASGTISDNGQIVVSNLAPGTYTSTESSLATDFALESISCDDGSSATPSTINLSTKTATFKLDPGETVKCTFTNKKLAPDLAVTKTADAASVTAGDSLGFSLSVINNGDGTAYNVTLSDSLPSIPGVTWAIASQPAGDPCTLTGASLSCTFGNLAPKATAGPVHITGTSAANSCGTWNNTATAQADNNAPVTNQASIFVDCATIKISKTAASSSVSAGDPISFTITVTNDNSGTAHNVTVSDNLPTNSGLGAWALSGTDAGACNISAGVLTCNFGDVAGHASKTVTLSNTTTAATCGTVSNTASVTTSNDGQDSGTASVNVQCPNLSVTKAPDAAAVNAGDPVGFTITVHNAGPGVAKSVTLTDALPAGLAWAVISPASGCTITSGTLTCSLGDLASSADASVHVAATSSPLTCGDLTNPQATATLANGAAASSDPATITVNCADVTVTKTGNGPISAGDTAEFTITVSVTGFGSLSNVTLNDPLPAGVTWALTPAVSGCSISGSAQVLSCSWPTMTAGTIINIAVSGTTAKTNCSAPLSNIATVAAANETDTTNNTASANIVVDCASINITKTNSTPTVSAGDPISYTITVTNTGSGIARNVVVTDTLPTGAGLNWSYPAACSVSGGVLTCNLGDIAGGGSKSITLTSPTTADNCGTVSNTASVSTTNDGSATSSPSIITVQCPNLSVTKTPDAASVSAGDTIGYTITASNAGPGEAKGVMISDALPGGLAWTVDAANTTASGCSINSGTLTCGPDTIASGGRVQVHITAASTPAVCGALSNSATATPTNGDAANSQTSEITVLCPDLTVTKTGNGPISAGDTATFTITVTNSGLGQARGVTLTDTLPGGLTWTIDAGNTTATGCSITADVLTCGPDTLASGASVKVTVNAVTSKDNCETLTNSASTAATNEANTSNNSASATIEVDCANIQIEKTTSTPTVSAGDSISYTITVRNTGIGTAKDVIVTDSLPGGLAWTISPAVPGCSISGSTLTCNFGSIASGGSNAVTVTATTAAVNCGTVSNTASVTTSNDGAASTPDTTITVQCPDVTVTKTPDAASVSAGDTIGFTITVTNSGLGKAYGVSLTDTLPTSAGTAWTIDPAVAGCAITGGVLTCTVGTLGPTASFSVHVSSPTSATTCGGTVDNTATVTATNEANTTNNSGGGSITVNCPSLTVTKTADAPSVNAGDVIGFTITVRNGGPGIAKSVTLTDTLPSGAGISWSLAGGTGAAYCAPVSGGVLTCSFGDMTAGASYDVHVTSPTDATSCGSYNNTATVTSDNQADVTGTDGVTVSCANISITKTSTTPTVSAGEPVSYTIIVSNGGDGTAHGVTVTDILPGNVGLDWTVNPPVTGCSIAGSILTCNLGDLAGHTSQTITLTSPTTYASCATLSNIASVTTSNDGSATSEPSTITVNCPALTVTKTADAATVSAGDMIGFTITVTNTGDGVARNVTLSDTLPTATGISWSLDPANADCTLSGASLSCSFGDLAKGESKTVHVTSPTTKYSCITYDNTATASANNQPSVTSPEASITVQCAAIQISKTADTGPFSAGDTIGFTIKVSNPGPGTAYGVTVTDTLPTYTGLDWAIAPAVTECSISGGVLTCNFGTVAPNTDKSVHISSPTTAASCGTVANSASVSTSNDGSGLAGDSLTVQCPDVTVAKTPDAASVSAGDTIGFTITVTNSGLGKAYGVSLTDTLPVSAGTAWTIDPAVGGCTITSGVLTCDIGTLNPAASVSVHVSSPTSAATCEGTVDNTATVTATNEPGGQPNNSSTASIDVLCATIAITKTSVPASGVVNAGDPIAFDITVTNTGEGTAKDVAINDILPDKPGLSWTITSITPANINGSCQLNLIDPQTLTCSFDQLTAGQSVTIAVSSPTTLATACSTIDNSASVTTGNDGSAQANASISVTCANIAITKEPVNATVSAGDPIAYDITVTNNGLSAASNVNISDSLPDKPGLSWTLTSIASVNINGYCQLSLISPQTLTCTFDKLDAGQSVTVRVGSPTTYASCGTVSNTAGVTTGNDGSDTTPPSNITVNCPALQVTKTPDTQTVSAGEPISFTITATDTGAGTAKNVTLSDQLSSDVAWSVDNAACGVDPNGLLTCDFGDLTPGGSASVTVTGDTVPAICGTLDNTATVKLANGPNVKSNTVSVTIQCPDITVTKEAISCTISAGDTAAFKIVVTNSGTGTAYGVTLTDNLPAGVAWAIDPAVAECQITGGVLSCSWSNLAAGASVTINVSGATSASVCGTLDNTATVAASNESANQTNNQASSSIGVNCSDVTVTKEAVSGTINAGDTAAYKIVVSNVGTGKAYNVTLNDTLPASIAWTIDPAVTGCAITGNTLSCSFTTLASEASIEINVKGITSAAVCGSLNNTATVAASNEANTSNNSASAGITVNCSDVKVIKEAIEDNVNVGDTAAFKIVVSNIGEGTAYDVTVTDTLPAGVTWTIDPGVTGCGISGNTLSCSFTTLAAEGSVTINVSGTTAAVVCGPLNNTVTTAASNEVNTTNNSANASITVYCPSVNKTASTYWNRDWDWTITKESDGSYNLFAGDTVTHNYKVTVDPTNTDNFWGVKGTITITNNNPDKEMVLTSVSDLAGSINAKVTCPNLTVPANDTLVCTYDTGPQNSPNVNPFSATNTATAVFAGANWTGTAPIVFSTSPTTENEPVVTVDDDNLTDETWSAEKAKGEWTYTEPFACSTDPAKYTDGKYSYSHTNTAMINETKQTDTAKVDVDCYWPQIDITKSGDTLSKISDKVYYDITVNNNTPTDAGLRALSCSISDTKIGFSKTVTLASGASDSNLDIEFTIPQVAEDPFINTASVTCSPLNSTFSVSDSAQWSTNLFQPAVEITKTGPANATSGDTITYSFTITNKSSSDSPNLMLDTLKDDVLGDLADDAPAACDELAYGASCTFTAAFTVPDVGLQPINKTNTVTVHYHPAGFPNDITDTDCHTVTIVPRSQLTDTSFCPLPNNQFRLLYHLEAAPNIYRMQASNPGQFYFNGSYYGTPGSDFTMTLQVPYPFVTQEGAGNPIQVHDGTGVNASGCYVPGPSLSGFTITTPAMTPTSSAGNQIITPEDYTTKQPGEFTTVTISGKVPETGFVYVTMHLDYSLKKTGSWKQTGTFTTNPITNTLIADVQNQAGFGSGPVTIHGYEVYSFARTVGGDTATTTPSSYNEFKKFAGFMGFMTVDEQPEPNVKVEILNSNKQLVDTVYTDEDGYYLLLYKHTSKAATYTVNLPEYPGQQVQVTVKANGFAAVDFDLSGSPQQELPKIHVGSLTATTSAAKGGKWNTNVAVTIHGATAGAAVTLLWSDGVTSTCTTGTSGTCGIIRSNIPSITSGLTVSVTDVMLSGYIYDAAANDITSLTINKPK